MSETRGIQADHPAGRVNERPPGETGIENQIEPNEAVDLYWIGRENTCGPARSATSDRVR